MIHVKQGPSRPGVRARGGYQPDPQHRAAAINLTRNIARLFSIQAWRRGRRASSGPE